MVRGMTGEWVAIAWGLVFLLASVCVALVELYWHWAERLEGRQNDIERRLDELQKLIDE